MATECQRGHRTDARHPMKRRLTSSRTTIWISNLCSRFYSSHSAARARNMASDKLLNNRPVAFASP